jgi:signal transduction histidine kinase
LRADKVVLFELDPDSRHVTIADQHGPLILRSAAIPGLIHSPVRDAAEDGVVILARDLAELAKARYVHLRPLADFGACLGVPAPTELHNRFALFAFFAAPTILSETAIARAEATAAKVTVWLERRQFTKRVADLQRVALLGQVARFLVHEISGGLTYFYMGLDRAQAEHNRIERTTPTTANQVMADAQPAREVLDDLKRRISGMKTTLHSFSHMARAGQEELLRLDELVAAAVKVLGGEAGDCHVELAVAPSAERLYFTRAQATFLQQVLINVILNAIQQIHQLRPRDKGRVLVGMSGAKQAGRSMIQVRVEDDGPGIHPRLWERIFEMDYSTRSDGCGLGLYISRSLIEAQGGRIYVADSHIHWGTTFIVELPFRLG